MTARTRSDLVRAAATWLGLEAAGDGDPRTRQAFRRLAGAHVLSAAGDAIVTVALAGSVFFSTSVSAARGRVALSLLLTLLPFAVIAPFLGPAIDRSRGGRRLMVIGAAAGRAIACVYMSRVVDNLLLFLPAALAVLILSKAHAVAKSSLVPATVTGSDTLVRAGSRLAVLAAACGLLAGAPGAAVMQLAGAAWALRVAAIVYAGGAIEAIRLRPASPIPVAPSAASAEVRNRGVAQAAVAMTLLRATVGFLTFAVAFDFRRTHASSLWFGLVVAGGVLGGFAGNLVAPAVREIASEERMLALTLGVVAIGGAGAWWADNRLAIAVFAFILGAAGGAARLAFDAIVQRDGDERIRSRSFARFEATFQVAWVVTAFIPTLFPGRGIPDRYAALTIAVAAAVGAAVYVLGRVRPSRPPRSPTVDRPGGPRRNPARDRAPG